MAEESGKGIALAILGIVAVIAIVGLVLLFSGAKKTGQVAYTGVDKVYGGALKDVEYPYLENRPAKGVPVLPEGVEVVDEQTAYAQGVPYRTYNRVPDQIPSTQTTCGEGSVEVSVNFLRQFKYTYPDAQCSDYVAALDAYCCKAPSFNNRY